MIEHGRLLKLQQVHLHGEVNQHDKNVRDNMPEAHGVPLEGSEQGVRVTA